MRPTVLFASLVLMTCSVTPLDPTRRVCGGADQVCPEPYLCVLVVGGDGGVCLRPENVCEPQVPACERSLGICAGLGRACLPTGHETVCTAASYGTEYEPVETRCDGRDNDCDGQTDESEDGGVLFGSLCELDAGVCAGARHACVGGSYETVCTPVSYGPAFSKVGDACDGLDNDCDGRPDISRPVELSGVGRQELLQGGGLWLLQTVPPGNLHRLSDTFEEDAQRFPLNAARGAVLELPQSLLVATWNSLGQDLMISATVLRDDGGFGNSVTLPTVPAGGLQQLGLGGTATEAAALWALPFDGGARAYANAFALTAGPPLMGEKPLLDLASMPTGLAIAAHDGGYVVAIGQRFSVTLAGFDSQLVKGGLSAELLLGSAPEGLRLIPGPSVTAAWSDLDGLHLVPDVTAASPAMLDLGPQQSWAVARANDGGLLVVTSTQAAGVTLRAGESAVQLAPPMGAVTVARSARGAAVAWSADGGTWLATTVCQ